MGIVANTPKNSDGSGIIGFFYEQITTHLKRPLSTQQCH
jgi:hypothetical protein